LPECDEIIVIKKGKIIGMGSYENLLITNEYFSKFVSKSFLVNQNEAEEIDDEKKDSKSK
jgi:ABC-type transport system involved in cytochrome bd biosynthesis fused ATPase/permease subunit